MNLHQSMSSLVLAAGMIAGLPGIVPGGNFRTFIFNPPPITAYLPLVTHSSTYNPIRAVRVQYTNYQNSRLELPAIQDHLTRVHANMIGLSAGRVEWAYFKWTTHPEYISSEVRDTGLDILGEDSIQYGKYGHIDAVIDVLSPKYILAHPDAAAINVFGQRSQLLVGTMELVEGEYGRLLLDMVENIAANYPRVNSISITELSYRLDGYGPQEKASYLAYSGKTDWPHQANGQIDIDDPSIGNWRSHVMDIYLDKLAAAAHAHGKQLFLDVSLSWNDLQKAANENGTRYDLMLEHIDKLVVWGYYYLENIPPEFLETAAQFLQRYGTQRVIMSIGLWGPNNSTMPSSLLMRGILASEKGGLPNLWITPSVMMDESMWQVLEAAWAN
jgi:hypothetical protein